MAIGYSALTGIPRLARWGTLLVAFVICGLAAVILARDVQTLTPERVANAIMGVPPAKILISILFTSASFAALGIYDVLATRLVAPARIPFWLAWFAGAAGSAVSNTLGFHAVTGTLVRYRLYRSVGLALPDTARIMSLAWATLAFGFVSVFALALLIHNADNADRIAGAVLLSALGLILYWLGPGGRNFSLGGFSLALPSRGLAALQMAIGAAEMAAAISALYVLMPVSAAGSFPAFSAIYIGAVLLGIVSHAPGGIGVFEAAMLSFAVGQDQAGVLAALLLYRVLYNFLPFACAALALAGFELVMRRKVSLTGGSAG